MTDTSIRDWTVVGQTAREEVTRKGQPPAHGRLLCFSSTNGWSAVEWSDTVVDVLAVATGKPPAALYAWWTRHGGPTA